MAHYHAAFPRFLKFTARCRGRQTPMRRDSFLLFHSLASVHFFNKQSFTIQSFVSSLSLLCALFPFSFRVSLLSLDSRPTLAFHLAYSTAAAARLLLSRENTQEDHIWSSEECIESPPSSSSFFFFFFSTHIAIYRAQENSQRGAHTLATTTPYSLAHHLAGHTTIKSSHLMN